MQKTLLAAKALAITLPATAYATSAQQHRVDAPFKIACTQTGCQRIAAHCQEKHGPTGIVPRGFDTIKCYGTSSYHVSASPIPTTIPLYRPDRT